MHYGEDEGMMPGTGKANYSGDTSKLIDQEVRQIIDSCYERAKQILHDNRDILEAMKDALMEYETIDSEQVDDLMARRKVRPPRDWHDDDFNSHLRGKESSAKGKTKKGDAPDDGKAGPIGGPARDH
jgi:cell division protease FtsH